MRAQAWSMDFAASVVIFITALAIAIFALNYTLNQNQSQIEMNMMENAAMSASDALVRQPGIPEDWDSSDVITLGLASQENILNESKLQNLLSLDNNTIKSLLGISNYNFYLEVRYANGSLASLPTGEGIVKGDPPSDASMVIPVERHVIYMGEIARMRLVLWKP